MAKVSDRIEKGWPIFMRPRVAASYLGVSEATIYRWIRDGRLPKPIEVSPQIKGWHQEALKRFADETFLPH